MKVLLADVVCWQEHATYNNYWIKVLNNLGVKYDLACFNGYSKHLDDFAGGMIYDLGVPHKSNSGVIRNLRTLYYLYNLINIKKYNFVIFTTINKLAFFFSPFFIHSNSIIVSHVWQEDIKFYHKLLYKLISKKHTMIALDEFIKNKLQENGIQTKVIPHPIPNSLPYCKQICTIQNHLTIFSPSKGIDKSLLNEIINSVDELNSWLLKKNIKLVLRSKNNDIKLSNLIISSKFIPKTEYYNLFYNSQAILIAYPKSFQLRVSNVFFESIAADKFIILKSGTHLDNYANSKSTVGIFRFDDLSSLKLIIEEMSKLQIKPCYEMIKENHSLDLMINQTKKIFI